MAFSYNTWGTSWGASWATSWGGSGVVPPTTTPAPEPGVRAGGGGGLSGFEGEVQARRIDYAAREEIAAEIKALYAEVVALAEGDAQLTEEAGDAVAAYAPVNAPAVPQIEVVDWLGLIEDQLALSALDAKLRALRDEAIALHARQLEDDALTLLLLSI